MTYKIWCMYVIIFFCVQGNLAFAATVADVKAKADENGGASLSLEECKLLGSKFGLFDDDGELHQDDGFNCKYVSKLFKERARKLRAQAEAERTEKNRLEYEQQQQKAREQQEMFASLFKDMDGPPVKSEAKAKIKPNKQYICSDGHDSYVLKYNGSVVVFGNIRLQYTFGNFYRDSLDKGRLRIDRETGKAVFDGTPMQCRPR